MDYDLSICIPTYNRGNFLDELIFSINNNLIDGINVEIAISDNCSTDNTIEVIKKWEKVIKCKITHVVNEKNIGPDLNYLNAVKIANGRYCWLVGSDDLLKPDALKVVYQKLINNDLIDIFLFNRTACDLNMDVIEETKWLDTTEDFIEYDLMKIEDFTDYCNRAKYLGAFFSYLSSIIIKKETWNKVEFDNNFNNTGYSHVYNILIMITKFKAKLLYLNQSFIFFRSGNDSFSEQGFYKRVMLDFDGYIKLSKLLETDKQKLFLSILKKEHKYPRILKLFSQNLTKKEYSQLHSVLKEVGHNSLFLNIINILANRKLVTVLLKIKKFLKIYRL